MDVKQIDPHALMEQVAFVFQNSRLFKASILENVRAHIAAGHARAGAGGAAGRPVPGYPGQKLPRLSIRSSARRPIFRRRTAHRAGARAISGRPSLNDMDEATAFADPENER